EYWFTCGSTYNYLTVNRIEDLADDAGVTLDLRPFYLGKIFRESGYWPFHPDTPKMNYMWDDIERTAATMGLAPDLPAPYPSPETDRANRVAWTMITMGFGLSWVKESYKSWFENGLLVGQDANLDQSLNALGLNRDVGLGREDEADQALLAQTEIAKSKGIFGAPTFVVGDEIYWGNDRLEQALAAAQV
ncbi:MAG: DsbA family protein, partial [Pseudomonadota bacterium]